MDRGGKEIDECFSWSPLNLNWLGTHGVCLNHKENGKRKLFGSIVNGDPLGS